MDSRKITITFPRPSSHPEHESIFTDVCKRLDGLDNDLERLELLCELLQSLQARYSRDWMVFADQLGGQTGEDILESICPELPAG